MSVSRRGFMLGLASSALQAACSGPIPPPRCTPLRSGNGCKGSALDLPDGLALTPTCCELIAFDEIHRSSATVYRPRTRPELSALLKAVPAGRTLTVRGGGQSLDSQSLNDDLVVILDQPLFQRIHSPEIDDKGHYFIRVGAGAPWWSVIEKVAPLGLMPPSCVTTGKATVGGTLSANCVSRSSPIYGKEGKQIRSFRIALASGDIVECARDSTDANKRQLFNAVIGGFGYLGVVIEVTFDLIVVRSNPNTWLESPAVLTRSTRHGPNVDWDSLLRSLHDKSRADRERYAREAASSQDNPGSRGGPLASSPKWSALSLASFLVGSGMSANLLEQRYVENTPLKPFPGGIYDKDSNVPANALRIAPGWPTIAETAIDIGFPQGEYVDELFGWLFFLGNSTRLAKDDSHRLGSSLNFYQQSFALPSGEDEKLDTRPMRRFIEYIEARFHAADARPAAIDFLHVPPDSFVMSASRDFPSFVVTITMADRNRHEMPTKTNDILRELSRDCRGLGGRVHLVKNVICDPSDLRAMHGDAAAEFKLLKKAYDPNDIFRNEFFERVFNA